MKKLLIIVLLCSIVKAEAQTSAFADIDSLLQIGRYKVALFQLEKLPSTFVSNNKIASVYEAIDNHTKASFYYQKALAIKDDYRTKIKLAKSYKRQQKLTKSVAVFEEIVKLDAENLLIAYELGKLYLQIRQPKKAIPIFKELIAQDSLNANYSYQLGLAYAQLKKRNLKINNFLNAFRKDSLHIKSIAKLAVDFTILRDRDSAMLFVDKGLKIHNKHKNLNKLKINDLYRSKRYTKAIDLLEHLDTVYPNEHYTKKMLGKAYYNIANFKKAEENFKKSIKLDREDFKAYTFLGHIYFKQKDFKRARIQYYLASFIGKKKRDEEYLGLANVFYETKKSKKVIENYEKAVKENSSNYTALYLLATFSEDYYKDKKIAYKLYKRYLNRFEDKDATKTKYVSERVEAIKKAYFLKGEELN